MKGSAKIAALISRLQRGDKLHVQLVNGHRVWWLEDPHENVSDEVVISVVSAGAVHEAGDSLFGLPLNSQTWEGNDG